MLHNLTLSRIDNLKIAINKEYINSSFLLDNCSIAQIKGNYGIIWKFFNRQLGFAGQFISLSQIILQKSNFRYNHQLHILNRSKKYLPANMIKKNIGITIGNSMYKLNKLESEEKIPTETNHIYKNKPINCKIFPYYYPITKNDFLYELDLQYFMKNIIWDHFSKKS